MNKYFIRDGYKERLNNSFHNDVGLTDGHQDEVYAYARLIYNQLQLKSVLDLGCGSAYKLFKYFTGENIIGIDLEPTVSWLRSTFPSGNWYSWGDYTSIKVDLVICSDMIEHVKDPDDVIYFIDSCKPKRVIISTPDRSLLPLGQNGPPNNECHVREWTFREFEDYLMYKGWKIHHSFISNKHQCTQLFEASI